MVKVVWTDSALYDLNNIGDHIAKDSERYAELTIIRLFNCVDILDNHPKAGKMVAEFQNDNLRELIRGSYRIVYHIINKSRIDILSVHHSARMIGNTFDFSTFDDE